MKTLKFTVLLAFLYVFSHTTQAGTVFVDQNLAANCSGASYNVASRNCSGSAGSAYKSIQSAINSASVGDVIYMREGTYTNISIQIPQSKNGDSWNDGDFTTLMSYPGEWAKIDATGLAAQNDTLDAVIYGYQGFGTGEDANYTEYWKFSNFEIMGGGSGVHMKMRHVKWYYMYIHDNGRSGVSDLQSGISAVNPQYAEIKYSYFKDNINAASPNLNMAHILFDADYRDDNVSKYGVNGGSFLENASTHHNEIAYNYFELTGGNVGAQHIAIRQKNQQRFGRNDRNPGGPEFMAYKEWGDNIHHNIVMGSVESIGVGQDFLQVHNNITDNGINIGRVGDVPTTYNAVIYNNTVIEPTTASFMTSSGLTKTGSSLSNFYDDSPQQTVHPHIDFYNNISDGNPNSYQDMPYFLHWDMPENTTNPNQNNFDLILENNFIHNNAHEFDVNVGHNYDTNNFSGCELQEKQISEFNACSKTWRGVGTVNNWKNSSNGLYLGTSGANKFITDHAFVLGGGKTICDGGKSGPHPYLAGIGIPGYVGATNPNDFAWVAGVLFDTTSEQWLASQVGESPSWIEKAGGQSGVCKAPPKPPTPAS